MLAYTVYRVHYRKPDLIHYCCYNHCVLPSDAMFVLYVCIQSAKYNLAC